MLKEWSEAYRIGVPVIDEQHRRFFAASHRLYESILDRESHQGVIEAIDFMRRYASEHFAAEELFMRRHDYPALTEHLRDHVAFHRRLDELENELTIFGPTEDLANQALDITQDWLIDHIADEDMLYALHVKSSQSVD